MEVVGQAYKSKRADLKLDKHHSAPKNNVYLFLDACFYFFVIAT